MSDISHPNIIAEYAHAVFEEEASSWEEKLNRIHVLFGKVLHLF
jgi:hypothetical protein